MTKQAEAAAHEEVERAVDTSSRQPRFTGDLDTVWGGVYTFLKTRELTQPRYQADSRGRDQWLRETWRKEPFWASVIKTCTLLDANRPWSLTGGRNQVYRYTRILTGADDGKGWRHYASFSSESFRTADVGAVTELGRDGRGGPLRGVYTVDPVCCRLTGKVDQPLNYYPRGQRMQQWEPDDFFRVSSMTSTDERMRGLGFCATSMAFELISLLYGVLRHDQEKVGARMPEGLLLLKGVEQDQWTQALAAREKKLDGDLQYKYGAVMVLASGGDYLPEAALTSLSELPPNFDREVFLDQTMYAYAGIVGYDPSEFWPVQTGSIGRGEEPEIQHRKATKKGGAEWALATQERIGDQLPDTLLYEFEAQDTEAQLQEAELAMSWTEVADAIQYGGSQSPRISDEQFLQLLVDKGVLPPEATELEEDIEATDTDQQRWRERVLRSPDLVRAVEAFPTEQIVKMRWTPLGMTQAVLFDRADEVLRPSVWRIAKRRQEPEDVEVLFEEGDVRITTEDVERAVSDAGRRVTGDGSREEPGMAALLLAETEPEEEGRSLLERIRKNWTERDRPA